MTPSRSILPSKRVLSFTAPCLLLAGLVLVAQDAAKPDAAVDPAEAAKAEAALLSETRQLTFEGLRAGEGYFSAD